MSLSTSTSNYLSFLYSSFTTKLTEKIVCHHHTHFLTSPFLLKPLKLGFFLYISTEAELLKVTKGIYVAKPSSLFSLNLTPSL